MHQYGYSDVFSFIIATIKNLNEPWGIKDTKSRHIYMNRAARLYTHTPDKFEIEGKFDYDFPTSWAENSTEFEKHDRLTEQLSQSVTVIETDYWFGNSNLEPYISEKIPLRDRDGNCIGTLWNARKIKIMSPLVCIGEKEPSVLQTSCDTSIFSKGEMDVLYLLLRRLSRKEIAIYLNLSIKTVDNRIQNMYRKGGVHSLIQFEEFCRNLDLHNYLPEHLVSKGVLFI